MLPNNCWNKTVIPNKQKEIGFSSPRQSPPEELNGKNPLLNYKFIRFLRLNRRCITDRTDVQFSDLFQSPAKPKSNWRTKNKPSNSRFDFNLFRFFRNKFIFQGDLYDQDRNWFQNRIIFHRQRTRLSPIFQIIHINHLLAWQMIQQE